MTPNQQAFLEMIAHSEIGEKLLQISDNGYNVIVGSTPSKPDLFTSYADHPRKLVDLGGKLNLKSTAAGRYQILARIYDFYKKPLQLKDFGKFSQDCIALHLIKERKALDAIELGQFELAVNRCATAWASLPGSLYGQNTNKIDDLQAAYVQAGGTIG